MAAAPVAAQETVAQINFQPAGVPTPVGWTADAGEVFTTARGFGWDAEVRTKDRDVNPDQRLDTHCYVSNTTTGTWEHALANGHYLVTVVVGSPRWTGNHTVVLEGTTVIDQAATTRDEFVEVFDRQVTVADGRLTVRIGGSGDSKKTKIAYLSIRTDPDGGTLPPNTPPEVGATGAPTSGDAPLTVAFTTTASDAEGPIASVLWDFDDGSTDTALNPSQTFTAAGTYAATVTVTDGGGLTATATVQIVVSEPPAPPPPAPGGDEVFVNFQPAGAPIPDGYQADTGVVFDAARGYGWDAEVQTKDRDVYPDQRLDTHCYVSNTTSATWDYAIADGSYEVTVVAGSARWSGNHAVAIEGTTVIDSVVTTRAEFVEVTRHPVTVSDGRLSVRIGGSGNSKKTKLCYLIIHGAAGGLPGQPPTATASGTPLSGPAPLDVAFTGAGSDPDGTAISFAWDFGDGNTSALQSPAHTYQTAGTYTARLTVTDADGRTAVASLTVSVAGTEAPPPGTVSASVETDPVPGGGDAADDPAIWLHPTDRSLSVIIGTDKASRRLVGYDLSGAELWRLDEPGKPNNVDVRGDVVVCSLRSFGTIGVYLMDPATRTLTKQGEIDVGVSPYGLALYVSPTTGKLYAFVSDSGSDVEQWEIESTSPLVGTLVRELDTAKTEGMAADDESGKLFLAEENVGLYVYDAEPGGGSARTQIGSVIDSHLAADLEGVCVYRAADGAGYVLVSVQGESSFAVYDRKAPYAYRGTFAIAGGVHDAVGSTDGIEVLNLDLGTGFSYGVFIAQDGRNTDPTEHQNFKLVPWERIADLLGLLKDATHESE